MTAWMMRSASVTITQAADAFLARRDLDTDTIRSYAQTMRLLRRELGGGMPPGEVTAEHTAAVFVEAWNGAAARMWNRHRAACAPSAPGVPTWPR